MASTKSASKAASAAKSSKASAKTAAVVATTAVAKCIPEQEPKATVSAPAAVLRNKQEQNHENNECESEWAVFFFLRELVGVDFKRDTFFFGDDLRNFPSERYDSLTVLFNPKCRDNCLLLQPFHEYVGQVTFGAVTDFDTALVLFHRRKNQDAFVRFAANAPAFGNVQGVISKVRIADVMDECYRKPKASFLVKLFRKCIDE